jgi:hypothetical protein
MGGNTTAGVPMHQQSVDHPWQHRVGALGRPCGRYFTLKGEISPVACRLPGDTKPQRTPLPATLLSGMAVAQIRRQIFWCRREARGTRPGSRARVVRLPMLPGHHADDPWSIDETFLTIASGDPKTWATNPQIPKSIRVRISWGFVTGGDDGGSQALMRPLGVPDHRVGLKTEEGHDATSNARDHHYAGALATARRGDVGFATRTV